MSQRHGEGWRLLETVELVQRIAVIVLAVSAAALCVAVTVALAALFPRLRRIAFNLERTTESTAETAANTAVISQSFADRSDEIAENLSQAAANANAASADMAQTMKNTASASQLLGPAGAVADFAAAARGHIPEIVNAARSALENEETVGRIRNPAIRRAVESILGTFRRKDAG